MNCIPPGRITQEGHGSLMGRPVGEEPGKPLNIGISTGRKPSCGVKCRLVSEMRLLSPTPSQGKDPLRYVEPHKSASDSIPPKSAEASRHANSPVIGHE